MKYERLIIFVDGCTRRGNRKDEFKKGDANGVQVLLGETATPQACAEWVRYRKDATGATWGIPGKAFSTSWLEGTGDDCYANYGGKEIVWNSRWESCWCKYLIYTKLVDVLLLAGITKDN